MIDTDSSLPDVLVCLFREGETPIDNSERFGSLIVVWFIRRVYEGLDMTTAANFPWRQGEFVSARDCILLLRLDLS